jgi:type IV fimbrial biogenesis protein FimT
MLNRRALGFSLIELMVGLTLLGILLMLALPSFSEMMQNRKLRTSAEAISAGLHAARSEALRLNRRVEFLLTDSDPDAGSVGGPNITTTGPNWMVRADMGGGAYSFIAGRSGREGQNQTDTSAMNVQFNAAIAVDPMAAPAVTANTVTFTSVGRALLAANATFDITNPAGGACKTAGGDEPMRCLRVFVTPGGQVRMCDPAVADKSDSRSC